MCGGRGTRLDASVEKPLVPVCGVPMVDRVCAALADARVETAHAVVSPHAPATRAHLHEAGVAVVDAPGEGYVADLGYALARVGTPALTVVADLPLLSAESVNRVLDAADGSLAAYVPVSLKRRLGASVDATVERGGRTLAPVGLNVAGKTDDAMYVTDDPRLAVNVNRPSDLRLAEARCE